ncbi:unnamed protein product [Miscanthus lutarioriparius]|uniref:F-box domain-containing protein n=1 Tax=Miscanthus lutarioriparius TaxID=422564 RepID=A0A811Q4W6_9POAL|nr:unnamed protein product [Miscanthus lutarioriparius]
MDDLARMLVRGLDFFMMGGNMLSLTKTAFTNLPHPPAATTAPLSGAVRALDRVDLISFLPGGILRDIVSRLPVKDATRTTVLSTRWRRVWHTTPLILVHAHLLPNASIGTGRNRLGADPRNIADAVSTVLAST